jgi:hypothetical protein
MSMQANGYLEELLRVEFASRFGHEKSRIELGDVLCISTKSLKPQEHAGEIWEHYSIPAYDANRRPTIEPADRIKSNKYIVDRDSILISKLNPSIKRLWLPACATDHPVCSTEFIVYKPLNLERKSFYATAIASDKFHEFFLAHVTGSTGSRQRTQPKATMSYPMPNPSDKEIGAFCSLADPMYDEIKNNELESARLEQVRDSLLPKLISGEIDASKVELPS